MAVPDIVIKAGIKSIIKVNGVNGFLDALMKAGNKYDVKSGKKYANTESEVDHYVKLVPELEKIKPQLIELMKKHREKAGLPI